ncbi:MAG TPA: arsenate reductase ArsC [Candidatus Binatia bacterium]
MADRIYNVLFLCTGNSARSILAECSMNRIGKGRFRALSAGSHPTGQVHPLALELLTELHYDATALRSKRWDEFAQAGSAPLDFVFTVCDSAAGEVCPVWPGQPMTAHWGVTDPAAFTGPVEEHRRLFRRVYLEIENRIRIFLSLPLRSLDKMSLQRKLDEIGKTTLKGIGDE